MDLQSFTKTKYNLKIQKNTTTGQQVSEEKREVVHITNHQGSANEGHRFHLTPVRMAVIKTQKRASSGEDVRKGSLLTHCWWECK
jgi:hypothetical protein